MIVDVARVVPLGTLGFRNFRISSEGIDGGGLWGTVVLFKDFFQLRYVCVSAAAMSVSIRLQETLQVFVNGVSVRPHQQRKIQTTKEQPLRTEGVVADFCCRRQPCLTQQVQNPKPGGTEPGRSPTSAGALKVHKHASSSDQWACGGVLAECLGSAL